MKWLVVTLIALSELVAFVEMVRIWRQKHTGIARKCFSSVLVIITVFGLLFYLFFTLNPETHSEQIPPSWY
jgi:uncharacterized BrkB/YihY/UPF0761 family membrane protein